MDESESETIRGDILGIYGYMPEDWQAILNYSRVQGRSLSDVFYDSERNVRYIFGSEAKLEKANWMKEGF